MSGISYAVFNPVSGQTTTDLSADEATAEFARVAKLIIATYVPAINLVIKSDTGDEAWSAITPVDVSIAVTLP